jgi:transmembrane sensor
MNHPRHTFTVKDSTREEAIEWIIDFCEGEVGPSECEEFEAWLKASPEHVRAYLQVSAFWEAAGDLNRHRKVEVDDLVRHAAAEHNIVELNVDSAASSSPSPAKHRVQTILSPRFAAAAALVLVCLASAAAIGWSRHKTYVTQVGEERTITLSDGSIVQLNARSRLKVRYSDAQRTVELIEGQALFRVAKNPARPFVVLGGGASVRAVGTQFDVDRKAEGTVITVVEGRVSVSSLANTTPSAVPTSVMLAAGEQVSVSPNAIAPPKRTDPSVATAWTQGRLIFDSTPLAEVLRQINRYNARPLSIDDPKLLSLHVSGTFPTTDSTQIIQFLTQRFGLVVHESPDGIRLSHD